MSDYTAEHFSAICQLVEEATADSIRGNRIVHVECLRPETYRAVCDALYIESDGDAEHPEGIREFWGETCDGDAWRVHVEVRS